MTDQTTANGYCSLRSLMRVYHLARKSGKFEKRRLNRGLGIAMRAKTAMVDFVDGAGVTIYTTPGREKQEHRFGIHTCDCRDQKDPLAPRYCKHRVAAMLIERARQMDEEQKKVASNERLSWDADASLSMQMGV